MRSRNSRTERRGQLSIRSTRQQRGSLWGFATAVVSAASRDLSQFGQILSADAALIAGEMAAATSSALASVHEDLQEFADVLYEKDDDLEADAKGCESSSKASENVISELCADHSPPSPIPDSNEPAPAADLAQDDAPGVSCATSGTSVRSSTIAPPVAPTAEIATTPVAAAGAAAAARVTASSRPPISQARPR